MQVKRRQRIAARDVRPEALPTRLKPIPNSAQRLQIARVARVAFDFFAQTTHEDVDRARRYERTFFPDGIKELVAGEDAPAVANEIFEQSELADRG